MRIQRENVSNTTILPEFFTLLICVDRPEGKPGVRANEVSISLGKKSLFHHVSLSWREKCFGRISSILSHSPSTLRGCLLGGSITVIICVWLPDSNPSLIHS